jgi:hypothetical protein
VFPPGTQVGPFEVLGPLGSGGMGEVYRARDTRLGREVALKVLPEHLSSNREGLARFAQEARSASSLNHPNIVTIFEIGTSANAPFLAMELIEGQTLRELMDAGPIPIRRTLDLAAQIADGLAKAHEAGIVHRDLKPDNVMITRDGFAKILDFGIAKLQAAREATGGTTQPGLTQTGLIVGTPDYMSPEQASGKILTFRSDQFSLGLILYEMLAGRRAFQRATAIQTLSAIIQDDPESLETLNPRVPPPLRWLVERCLSKEPEERYNSSRDMARELKLLRERAGEVLGSGDVRAASRTASPWVPSTATAQAPLARPAPAITPVPAAGTPSPVVAPARSRVRRLLEFLGVLLGAGVLFFGGLLGGIWLRDQQIEPPPPMWKADLLLGSTARVISPRVSPDGSTLAFVTQAGGASQVAVLKPASGDWTVVTRANRAGAIQKVCWTRDGNKLLFDRVSDVPHGIFSIPPLGGEERLVVENAQAPEALPDGSLLFVRRDASRNFALHRFWPDTGRVQALGPPLSPDSAGLSLRAFPDGARAIFWARLASAGAQEPRRLYLLQIGGGKITEFARELPLAPPIAVGQDGRSVVAFLTAGDLQQLAVVPDTGDKVDVLFPVTERPWFVDTGSDGSVYVDTMDNSGELLRFPVAGGLPERIASTGRGLLMSPVELPGGGLLLPVQTLGRRRLFVAAGGGQLRPLLDIDEQAMPPAVVVGDRRLAFLSGGRGQPPLVTLASLPEGRVVGRLEATRGTAPQSIAASPDGTTIFYVHSGTLYAIPTEGGEAKSLGPASGVAVDARPPAPSLVVQLNDVDGVKLFRQPIAGGERQPIPIISALRLHAAPLSASAVGPDGRIAVGVISSDADSRGVALLDPATGFLERIPVAFDGDMHYPAWGRDGTLLATGVAIRTSLWRFRPHTAPGSGAVAGRTP